MRGDAYGLPATTGEPAALDRYDEGSAAPRLGPGAGDAFHEATRLDPGLALAHAGSAVCMFLEERFAPAGRRRSPPAPPRRPRTPREQSHVEAVALLVGRPPRGGRAADGGASRRLAPGRRRPPAPLLRLVLAGPFPGDPRPDEPRAPPLRRGTHVLGLHAFGLEQADRCREAVQAAETAMARNPRDAWAIHALAHGLYELAAFDEGVGRLPPAIHPCQHLNWFRNHLVWHLALMHLSRGDYSRAVRMSRAAFERAPSAIAGDLHDSISLLWRQDLVGLPVGRGRWGPFATIARERLDRQGLLFHAAHLGMALAGAGDWATAETSSACCASALRGTRRGSWARCSSRSSRASRRSREGVPDGIDRIEPLRPAGRAGRQPRPAGCLPRHPARGMLPRRRRRARHPAPGRARGPPPRPLLASPRPRPHLLPAAHLSRLSRDAEAATRVSSDPVPLMAPG